MISPLLRRFLPLLPALAVVLFVGCGSGDETPGAGADAGAKKRIVILTNGDDPFWDPCEAGANEAAKTLKLDEKGYAVSFERSNFTVPGQVDKLRQYGLATDIVAVGVSVYDFQSPAIADELEKLGKQGVQIVCIDGDVDREQFRDVRYGYLGTDNVIGGRKLGLAAKTLRPTGGKYVAFVGNAGNSNARARIDGFADGAGGSFEKLGEAEDGGDPTVARTKVTDSFERHGDDLNTLVGIWAYDGPAAVDVAEKRGRLDDVTIVTFDADQGSIEAMGEGKLDAMVVQNPFQMGYDGVRALYALVEEDDSAIAEFFPEKSAGKDIYTTGLKVVVPNEDSPIWKAKDEFTDDVTEVLLLEDFRAWLKKYNLKSS